jgi:hypothetical protein
MMVFGCTCGGHATLRMTRENMFRIAAASALRYPGVQDLGFNLGAVPDDVDLTVPVSAATIARVVRLCVSVDEGR